MAVEINPVAEKRETSALLFEIVELCLIGIGIDAMVSWLPLRYFLDGFVAWLSSLTSPRLYYWLWQSKRCQSCKS